MLTYADVCWRMLAYAEQTVAAKTFAQGFYGSVDFLGPDCQEQVRMLTYADVC